MMRYSRINDAWSGALDAPAPAPAPAANSATPTLSPAASSSPTRVDIAPYVTRASPPPAASPVQSVGALSSSPIRNAPSDLASAPSIDTPPVSTSNQWLLYSGLLEQQIRARDQQLDFERRQALAQQSWQVAPTLGARMYAYDAPAPYAYPYATPAPPYTPYPCVAPAPPVVYASAPVAVPPPRLALWLLPLVVLFVLFALFALFVLYALGRLQRSVDSLRAADRPYASIATDATRYRPAPVAPSTGLLSDT